MDADEHIRFDALKIRDIAMMSSQSPRESASRRSLMKWRSVTPTWPTSCERGGAP
jgi:hypothetical protein